MSIPVKKFKAFNNAANSLLGVGGALVLEILRLVLNDEIQMSDGDGNLMEWLRDSLNIPVRGSVLEKLREEVDRVTGMVGYGDQYTPEVEETILYLDDVIHGDPDVDVMEVTITGKAARDIRALADQIREGKQE